MRVLFSLVATTLMLAAAALQAAPADPATKPAPPGAEPKTALKTQTRSLPARGLFQGDRLTESARSQLADLIVDAIGQEVEVALLVPTGPWKIDESGASNDERTLTPARLDAIKRFLAERGLDPKKIYVESRIDEKLKEPRLEVQFVTRPATDRWAETAAGPARQPRKQNPPARYRPREALDDAGTPQPVGRVCDQAGVTLA